MSSESVREYSKNAGGASLKECIGKVRMSFFKQSRNVILTASSCGDAGRIATDDRVRKTGCIEEGEKNLITV